MNEDKQRPSTKFGPNAHMLGYVVAIVLHFSSFVIPVNSEE